MSDAQLTTFLGRAPTDADRAIYADQAKRLAAIYDTPLLPLTEGLQALSPFSGAKP
ncbi:hypothetical protein [Yoonia maritima]|uniref:hypothetical protein n=1 Tax=Yoonia maritima TaxID=1435347 RepID=UPI0013A6411B|nr:hypothetical protein [Yoonia maritima]